jgi:hypothetical protein
MNRKALSVLGFAARFAGGMVFSLLCVDVPAAQEMSEQAEALPPQRYVEKNELSPEEYREYVTRVEDLRAKFQDEYRLLQAFGNPQVMIQRWFRTVDYVKDARVEMPLFTSDPPQVGVHLQVELTGKKIVQDEVRFYLPITPQLLFKDDPRYKPQVWELKPE